MKRREILKSIKILGMTAIFGGMLVGCGNPKETKLEQDKVVEKEVVEEVIVEKELSERDKLIINREAMNFADPANPTNFEYKHTPEIILGEEAPKGFTTIEIKVGQKDIVHPVEDNHWVDFITLYADDQLVGHLEFEAGQSLGFATFYVQLEGVKEIKAVAGCNLHGIWESVLAL